MMSATPTKRLLLVLCILWGGNSGFYQRNQSTVPSLMSLFVNESQLASADADKANVIQPSTPCHTISAWTGDFGGVREVGGWAGQMLGSNEGRASCPEWLHINMDLMRLTKCVLLWPTGLMYDCRLMQGKPWVTQEPSGRAIWGW